MIEKTVYDYLQGTLDVPVFMELPEVPSEDFPVWPECFVLIEKIAERVSDHVHTASVALQSYSTESLYKAAELDETVRDTMDDMPGLPEIGSCRMSSNYNFTDTRTKRYRYQCVYDIVFVR